MKKIIDHKVYNTDTAEHLAGWTNGDIGLKYCEETLYRTKNGTYFLHGEGGAMSPYNKYCGNGSYSGGSDIMPLTIDEAKAWAEDHTSADTYISIFGAVEEA